MKFIVAYTHQSPVANSAALHTALELKREGDVVMTVCLGFPECGTQANDTTVYGVSEAYCLVDECFEGADDFAKARELQAVIKVKGGEEYIILTDNDGDDRESVYSCLSGLMGTQMFSYATKVEFKGDRLVCTQNYLDGFRSFYVPSGSVISMETIDIIILATNDSTDAVSLDRIELELGRFSCGEKGSHVVVIHEGDA